jgi:hypothetical protein
LIKVEEAKDIRFSVWTYLLAMTASSRITPSMKCTLERCLLLVPLRVNAEDVIYAPSKTGELECVARLTKLAALKVMINRN